MKSVVKMCVVAVAMTCVAFAQQSGKPLQRGIHVEMAAANNAVQIPAADEKNATVVTVTEDGKLFLGDKSVDMDALKTLSEGTVYVKADARTHYQKVLAVLDALHGRSVVLLTAPASKPEQGAMVPPYGVKLTVGGE